MHITSEHSCISDVEMDLDAGLVRLILVLETDSDKVGSPFYETNGLNQVFPTSMMLITVYTSSNTGSLLTHVQCS